MNEPLSPRPSAISGRGKETAARHVEGGSSCLHSGWSAFEYVQNENLFTTQIDCSEDFIKLLPRSSNKRFAKTVFLGTRRFTYKNEIGIGITDTKYEMCPGLAQRTLLTIFYIAVELGKVL